jgi:hypothetical protein
MLLSVESPILAVLLCMLLRRMLQILNGVQTMPLNDLRMMRWLLIASLAVLYGFTTLLSSLLIVVRGSLVVFADIRHRLYSVLVSDRMPLDLPLIGRLGRNAKGSLASHYDRRATECSRGSPVLSGGGPINGTTEETEENGR